MTNFKKTIIGLAVVGSGAAVLVASLVFAQSASPSLTINGVANNTFYVGQSWTLSLSGAPANSSFSLCSGTSCTPVTSLEESNPPAVSGPTVTDQNGNWAGTGSFAAVTNGNFIEWAQLPDGTKSNSIVITVDQTAPAAATPYCNGTGAAGICNLEQGLACINPGASNAYCGLPDGPEGATISSILAAHNLPTTGQCANDVLYSKSDDDACETAFIQEALALGYSGTTCTPDSITPATEAGDIYNLYSYTCTVSGPGVLGPVPASCAVDPQGIAGYQGSPYTNWGDFLQGDICSNSSTGSTSTGSTGTTSSGSQTTTSVTTTQNNTSPASVSTVNSILSSALSGFSSALGSATGASTTSGTGSSNVCASAAASTIASSVQTLQGLSTILSSGNVSAGVMTSIQNLINAVAQVLASLSTCISS